MTRRAKLGYLLPGVINPPGSICIQVNVPDDLYHIAAFWGAIQELGERWNWELPDSIEAMQTASKWQTVIAEARNCMDCCVSDIRVSNDGKLQIKVGGDWQDANGDGGDTTVINNQTNIIQNLYPPDPIDNSISDAARSCNIANGLSQWIFDSCQDMLNATEATVDVITAADSILALFPPAYLITDQSTDVINEIFEAGINTLRAQYDIGERENMTCAINTFIANNGNSITASNVVGLKQAITDAPASPLDQLIIAFMDMLENDALIHRGMLYQSDASGVDCDLLCADILGCTLFQADNTEGWEIYTSTFSPGVCESQPGVSNAGSGSFVVDWLAPGGNKVLIKQVQLFDSHANATGSVSEKLFNDGVLVQALRDVSGGLGQVDCFLVDHKNVNRLADQVRFTANSPASYAISGLKVCYETGIWQVTWDFTIDDYDADWQPKNASLLGGVYVAGQGWRTSLISAGNQRKIELLSQEQAEILQVKWTISDWVNGVEVCSRLNRLYENATLTVLSDQSQFAAATYEWNGAQNFIPLLTLRPGCRNDSIDPAGQATISKIVMQGRGTYPFTKPQD